MPTLAATLKAEIKRLAGRELKRSLGPLRRVQKQMKALRLRYRAQRQDLLRLKRGMARLRKRARAAAVRGWGAVAGRGPRVSPGSIRALRDRLRMTREQFAKVLAVSPGSVFGWESGRTAPRGRNISRIAEVKKMGVRKARAKAAGPRRVVRRKRRAKGRRARAA